MILISYRNWEPHLVFCPLPPNPVSLLNQKDLWLECIVKNINLILSTKNNPGLDNKIPNFINQNTHESYHSVTSQLQYLISATLDDKLRGLLA